MEPKGLIEMGQASWLIAAIETDMVQCALAALGRVSWGQYIYCKVSKFQSYYRGMLVEYSASASQIRRSRQTVVNGTAMVLAIANNIFSLRRSRGQ